MGIDGLFFKCWKIGLSMKTTKWKIKKKLYFHNLFTKDFFLLGLLLATWLCNILFSKYIGHNLKPFEVLKENGWEVCKEKGILTFLCALSKSICHQCERAPTCLLKLKQHKQNL